MPSHLTRLVFRSLIANEPLLYRGCRYRAVRPHFINHTGPRALPRIQRRTFFELFKQRRKIKPPEIPAGLETLSELVHAQKTGVRPPKADAIADAFKAFFAQRKGAFDDFYISRANVALKHLLQNPREDGQPWLSNKELDEIFRKLLHTDHRPQKGGEEHVRFGRALLGQIMKQNELGVGEEAVSDGQKLDRLLQQDFNLVRLLSIFGSATEARDIVANKFTSTTKLSPEQHKLLRKAWGTMLGGIVRQGSIEEMRKTTALMQSTSILMNTRMQYDIVAFFAERKELEEARFWYAYPVVNMFGKEGASPSGKTSAALLKVCALSGELSLGQEVVASLLKNAMPGKESWDAVFLWSAAIGKGVDEVDRMMSVMIRRNDEARQKDPSVAIIRPDVDTINSLVDLAISKKDPYTAERYIALGEKRGIPPDERTYAMQIQYRLSVNDIDGARAAYFNLQGDFSGAEQSVSVVNQLIQALCRAKQQHFDELMVMVDDLHERKASFAPETIASLCVLHLHRGEMHDAMDLLQVHAHQFAPEQRRIIQRGLLACILDAETSTADAWDTYQIMRNVFQETPRDDRLQVMKEFFARKRSDMACHVFFHMRNHISPQIAATGDVYVEAFTGFSHCEDAESLELAHNQLKLDLGVDFDTKLRNALMLAYAATKQNKKALQFWREICESKEGPSYNSLAIAFRSCEGMHFGHEHARSIWKRLREQDVEIDRSIWTAYMCALARNHQHEEAQALVETVEDEFGFTPDLEV
ncbi:hypothetical protein EK21DRAFT_70925 [Setomelanomma holmii]|uniref:Complex I intermediate-associated protein 84 n=1 Tax=Setomelanomma holmii TaxID=210430 RepID=A0A9P4LIE3_9PLEO|nr:hypothetical protein EK21DRAFT_70925 [Setomelanomma holmii]